MGAHIRVARCAVCVHDHRRAPSICVPLWYVQNLNSYQRCALLACVDSCATVAYAFERGTKDLRHEPCATRSIFIVCQFRHEQYEILVYIDTQTYIRLSMYNVNYTFVHIIDNWQFGSADRIS